MREVQRRVAPATARRELALDVYCYRIRKYVGAYLAALGGADAIVFTAGVGENDAVVRARSLAGLERLGIAVDPARNEARRAGDLPRRRAVAVLVDPDRRGARDGDPGGRGRARGVDDPVAVVGRPQVAKLDPDRADRPVGAHGRERAGRRP